MSRATDSIAIGMYPETETEWEDFAKWMANEDYKEHKDLIDSWNIKTREELLADYNNAKALLTECSTCAKKYEDDAVKVVRIGKCIIDNHREEYDRLIKNYSKTRKKCSKEEKSGLLQKSNDLLTLLYAEITDTIEKNNLSHFVYFIHRDSGRDYGIFGYHYLLEDYVPSFLPKDVISKLTHEKPPLKINGRTYKDMCVMSNGGWQNFQGIKEIDELEYTARNLANRLGVDSDKEIDSELMRDFPTYNASKSVGFTQYAGWYPTELFPTRWKETAI